MTCPFEGHIEDFIVGLTEGLKVMLQHYSNIATMCCAKNCRYESSRVTSPLHPSDSSEPLNFVSKIRHGSCTHSS